MHQHYQENLDLLDAPAPSGDRFRKRCGARPAWHSAILLAMGERLTIAECCEILEVGIEATPSQIRRAYQRVALIWHPDRFLEGTELHREAEDKFKLINKAYAFLSENQPTASPEGKATTGLAGAVEDPVWSEPSGKPHRGATASKKGHSGGDSYNSLFGTKLLGLAACLASLAAMGWLLTHRSAPPEGGNAQQNHQGQSLPAEKENSKPMDFNSKPQSASIIIDQPAVIIFSPSQKELDESNGLKAASIDAFLDNARMIRGKLHSKRPDIRVQLTDANDIMVGDELVSRRNTCGFGYILYLPLQRPRIVEGLQPIDGMVEFIDEFFPHGGAGADRGTD